MGRTNFKLTLLIVHWLEGFGIEARVRSRRHDVITFSNHVISVRGYRAPKLVAVYPSWIGMGKEVMYVDPEEPDFLRKIADCLGLGT